MTSLVPIKKKWLLIFMIAYLALSWINVSYAADTATTPTYSGAESSIKDLLCTPDSTNSANALYTCINKLYKFAIAAASVVAVLFIVIAGYVYMNSQGNQESVDKAKSILESSIVALVILFGGYVLLRAINPDLIQLKSIQPPSVTGTSPATITVGGSAQQIASQILSSGNVTLAATHSSGVSDNATALQNIKDTAAGTNASLSKYQGAPGGTVALNSKMLAAILSISGQYKISISEIAGGSHPEENSTGGAAGHYGGNAFDINYVNGSHLTSGNQYIQPLMTLCKSLGASQVIDESSSGNHVHCGAF